MKKIIVLPDVFMWLRRTGTTDKQMQTARNFFRYFFIQGNIVTTFS